MIPRIRCSRSDTACSDNFSLPGEATVVVVGRAGALGRDHARADRSLGRARGAEDLALPRLYDALQNLAALARLGIRDAHAGDAPAQLRVQVRVRRGQLEPALRDEAHAAPLEVRPQLENLGHD